MAVNAQTRRHKWLTTCTGASPLRPLFSKKYRFFDSLTGQIFICPVLYTTAPCKAFALQGAAYIFLLLLKLEVVYATLEQKLFLVAVDIHAGVRADTLCVTHLTEYTAVRRDDTFDSAH